MTVLGYTLVLGYVLSVIGLVLAILEERRDR